MNAEKLIEEADKHDKDFHKATLEQTLIKIEEYLDKLSSLARTYELKAKEIREVLSQYGR